MTGGAGGPHGRDRGCELTALAADGTPLHVEMHGAEGAPAVLLAHDRALSARVWDAVVADLAADHLVIAYDQRGHARTPPRAAGAGPPGLATAADDLCTVLEACLGPGERAVLAGHGLGALAILAAAGPRLLRRASAAVLCSPDGGPARLPLGVWPPLTRWLFRRRVLGPYAPGAAAGACARMAHDGRGGGARSWAAALRGVDAVRDTAPGRLDVPSAVLVGGAEPVAARAGARAVAGALPWCAGVTEVGGAGRVLPLEAPGAVARSVRALAPAGRPAPTQNRRSPA
ncbi:alpha/beta fold hydrolase [Streptomyces sp. MAR4 CNX-425]|uniref:alpha/beta hydrolase n=1 Tax=Streptomyces sp. MAR4 CNX-425 TaxID=3406343 RepID=UPI003B50E5A1